MVDITKVTPVWSRFLYHTGGNYDSNDIVFNTIIIVIIIITIVAVLQVKTTVLVVWSFEALSLHSWGGGGVGEVVKRN